MKNIEIENNIAQRYIKASNDGKFNYHDEIEILKYLVDKFKLKSISDFAKAKNITYMGAVHRIKSGKEMTINILNKTYVL